MHFHFIAKRNAVGQQLRQGGVGRGCPGGVGAEKVDLSLQNRRRLPGGRPWPRSLPTSQPLCPSMSAHGKWHQAPTGHRVNGITIAIVISVTIATDHRRMASNSHRSQHDHHTCHKHCQCHRHHHHNLQYHCHRSRVDGIKFPQVKGEWL